MFERFTNRARRVVVLAQEEARLLNHGYIGTEHLLLGLLADGEGIAARALDEIGIKLDTVRQEVEQILGRGKKEVRIGHIPFTPRAKKVLELSLREALRLGHNYIGTEHILLGIIREGNGVAAQILTRLSGDLPTVRIHVIRLARGGEGEPDRDPEDIAAEAMARTVTMRAGVHEMLHDISRRLANIEAHLGIARPDPDAAEAGPRAGGTAASGTEASGTEASGTEASGTEASATDAAAASEAAEPDEPG